MSASQGKGRSLQEVVDRLFECAGTAEKAKEPERTRLIDEALTLACIYLTRLSHRIERYVDEAVRQSGLNPEGTPISVIDLARSHDELEIFRDQDALRDFLDALGDNMLKGGYIDEDRLKELKDLTLDSYEKLAEQSVDSSELIKNFLIVKGICCSSPDDPGSDSPQAPRGGPNTGGAWKTAERALSILANLATIAALFLALHQEPKTPTPPAQPNVPHAPLRLSF